MSPKKTLLILFGLVTSVFIVVSCVGDTGPQGPAGPEGPEGPQGPPGGDLAQNCVVCHSNDQLIEEKTVQWQNSIHGIGEHAGYASFSGSCAVCHSSQGFVEAAALKSEDGMMPLSTTVPATPLSQNCYTCHNIHESYTINDWDLRESNPVKFWVGEEVADLGSANLCINCHQARVPEFLPEPGVGDDETIMINSSRYGPHHGSQGMMFSGNAGYEISGPTAYENSAHAGALKDGGCISCHMNEPAVASSSNVAIAGGHTFRIRSEEGELNALACEPCHNEARANELADSVSVILTGLLSELGAKLVTVGILDSATMSRSVPGTYTNLEIGAMWNYKYVEEDQSFGVHNYKYAKALLENSIAALEE